MDPKSIKVGEPVWYRVWVSRGDPFAAVVDSEPWLLGGQTWVCRLRELGPEYARATGRKPGTTIVSAAACDALSPRGESEFKSMGPWDYASVKAAVEDSCTSAAFTCADNRNPEPCPACEVWLKLTGRWR